MLLWQKYSSINMDDFLRSIEAVATAIIEKNDTVFAQFVYIIGFQKDLIGI